MIVTTALFVKNRLALMKERLLDIHPTCYNRQVLIAELFMDYEM
jgi:hypothetical protein